MNNLQEIKKEANHLFIKKEGIDPNASNVVAGIIKAASWMAIAGDVIGRDATMDTLIDAYGVRDNELINNLIGLMNPPAVHAATGFATDFMDYGAASRAYNAQKAKYDKLYTDVKAYSESKEFGMKK